MGFNEFLFENHLAFTLSIVMQANVEQQQKVSHWMQQMDGSI